MTLFSAAWQKHIDNKCERWRRRSGEREGKEDEIVCSSEMQIWNLPLETHRWGRICGASEKIYIYFRVGETFFLREQIIRAVSSQVVLVFLKIFYFRNCSGPLPSARSRSNTLHICSISQIEYNTEFSARSDCIIATRCSAATKYFFFTNKSIYYICVVQYRSFQYNALINFNANCLAVNVNKLYYIFGNRLFSFIFKFLY